MAASAALVAIAASTFLPGAPFLSLDLVVVMSFIAFPLSAWAVISMTRRRLGLKSVWNALPAGTRRTSGAIILVLWLSTMSGLFSSVWGAPEIVDGRFVLNRHGSVLRVTRSEYLRAVTMYERVFASVTAVFCVLTVAVGSAIAANDGKGPGPA